MTDGGPKAISASLDREGWNQVEAQSIERLPPTDRVAAAVQVAFRAIRSANLAPEFGFPLDDAERIWATKLAMYKPEAIVAAADEWIGRPDVKFPTLNEFALLVGEKQRGEGREKREPTDANPCIECGRSPSNRNGGWVTIEDPAAPRGHWVRPCAICNPDGYSLWRAGHCNPRPEHSLCACRHALCPATKKRQAS